MSLSGTKKDTRKRAAYFREWRKRNKEQLLANERVRDAARRARPGLAEKAREATREWNKKNPDKRKVKGIRRRARHAQAVGSFTTQDIRLIRALQGNRCAEPTCRKSFEHIKAHIDHIVPLSRGGTNWPRNLQLLCVSCNTRKGARDPIEHAKIMGRLL